MATLVSANLRISAANLRAACDAVFAPHRPVSEHALVTSLLSQFEADGLWAQLTADGELTVTGVKRNLDLSDLDQAALVALLWKVAPHAVEGSEVTLEGVDDGELRWRITGGQLRQRWAHLDWVTVD